MAFLETLDIEQLLTAAGFVAFLLHRVIRLEGLLDKAHADKTEVQNNRIADLHAQNQDYLEAIRKLDEIARLHRDGGQ